MKNYTPEQVARIVQLRELRLQLLRGETTLKCTAHKLRNINGELYQLTKNPAYR